ncbi:MAG: GTP-binding protein [Methanobacteriota archaeon]|nr:MAG: GTP-binding protein [Euryarchaeota archaeon]
MTANEEPQYKEKKMKMKICLIGEGAVGKTSLIRRYVLDEFDDKYLQTLGTKVSKRELEIPVEHEGTLIKVDMTIWDIMGQKGFRELLKDAYFYGAKGIIAVCDVTRRATLEDLDDWIEGVYNVSGKIPIQFLANKADLEDEVSMNEKDLEQAAKAYDSRYYFTSAKTGKNVERAFLELAKKIGTEEATKDSKKAAK